MAEDGVEAVEESCVDHVRDVAVRVHQVYVEDVVVDHVVVVHEEALAASCSWTHLLEQSIELALKDPVLEGEQVLCSSISSILIRCVIV